MSSRAAFSGSTTSASSTARRRCPPAATSTRPTARPGWCSSASRCCASRSSSRCTSRCTRSSSRSSSSTRCALPARWIGSANTRTRCGTRRTASSTTCCACRTARATRLKVRSIVGLLPLAAVAVFEEDILAKLPKFRERARAVRRAPSRARRQHAPAERARRGRPPHAVDRRREEAAAHPRAHAGRGGVLRPARHSRAVALPPRPPVRLPPRRAGASRGLRAGRFRHRHVRRQFQLARAGLDADQLPAVHARCCASTPTTARTSRSSARPAPGR